MLSSPPADSLLRSIALRRYSIVLLLVIAPFVVAFLARDLSFIPATVDGIDSTNFVLGVDRYSPRLHQPHPPGFPVHIALGRLVTSAVRTLVPTADHVGTAAASLRVWSALCGALAVLVVIWLARAIGFSTLQAGIVMALAATCPLLWITAMRPLSDVPGLLFSLVAQTAALFAYNRTPHEDAATKFQYRWIIAGLLAGIAIGVRVQTSLLTLPLLTVLAVLQARKHGATVILQVAAALVAGLLVWAIPMTVAVGGPAEYVRLLTTVAADDVDGVEMLATQPTPRLFARAVVRTFVVPWGMLGWGVVAFSALGVLTLARHNRRAFAIVAAIGLPYFLFHFTFQETASIRYALPLVPVSAILIAANLREQATRWAVPIAALFIATNLVVSVGAARTYLHVESPVARALDDLKVEAATRPEPPTLAYHHSVGLAIRAEGWLGHELPAPVRYEWLQLAEHWLSGRRGPVWFLADPRRTDLALVDPASRQPMRLYEWPANTAPLLGGIQPARVSWHEIQSPGWFLMEGWGVTPETLGLARRDGHTSINDGIVGYIRRRTTPAVMMIGGRNLGGACETAATIEIQIDGRKELTWTAPSRTSFLETLTLAPGALAGTGDYATVKVVARDTTGEGRLVDVLIEQFDVQSDGTAMAAFDRGWQPAELDPATGITWRWTDAVAELRTESFGRDVELTITGESPLRYFQQPPHVVVKAGMTELASYSPAADFNWTISIPAAVLAAADGRVTIHSDRTFIADQVLHNGDERRMALRIYDVRVRSRD